MTLAVLDARQGPLALLSMGENTELARQSAVASAASATAAQVASTEAEAHAADAQAVVGSLDRFYATRAAGAAALATGEWFTSAEEGFLAWYERTGTAPNYVFRDLVYQVPVLRPALQVLPFAMHAAILAGTSTADASVLINAALADGEVLELPPLGRIAIEDTLRAGSNRGLKGSYGCTIWAAPDFGDNPLFQNLTNLAASNAARDENVICDGVTFDGNKAANSTASAFSHCVKLNGVASAQLGVRAKDAKGDGVSIQQSEGNQAVGSAHVYGRLRTSGCVRQGTAISCGELMELTCIDEGSECCALLLEGDNSSNFLRDMKLTCISKNTGDVDSVLSATTGGVTVAGDGTGCKPSNIHVHMLVRNPGGAGLSFRDNVGCRYTGKIFDAEEASISGIGGGVDPSTAEFDMETFGGLSGFSGRETAGSVYNGRVIVHDPVGSAAQIELATGGTLEIIADGAGDQGVVLDGVTGMTFPNFAVSGSAGVNVRLKGDSSGNRFLNPKVSGSGIAQGVLEESAVEGVGGAASTGTPDGNVFLHGRVEQGVTLLGADSHVEPEPVAALASTTVETLRVPANQMVGMTGEAAASGTVTAAGSGITLPVFDFDADAVESVNFAVPMPKGWNEGTVQAQLLWTAGATGSVVWGVQSVAVSDDDVLSPALGAEVQVTDAVTAAGDLMISAYSGAMTVAASPAAEDLVLFRVFRYASLPGDDLAADARLIAVRVKFTRDGDDA